MRRPAALLALASVAIASVIACVDLFHSTSDVQSLCEVDANDPRCDSGAEAAPPELCAGDAGAAQARAIKACAWLSACGHPIGRNKTGECIVDAVMAYDCAANPNRKPLGKAKAFWQCMETVATCAAVLDCVFPDTPPPCNNGTFVGCSQSTKNPDSRVDCVQKSNAANGENCEAFGQTCDAIDPDASNRNALCVGPQRRTCTSIGCVGTNLSVCDDASVDLGYDCAQFGAGSCFPSGASPACKPAGAGTCAATNDITCTAGSIVAQGCVTGVPETVDCTAISGKGTCVPIEGGAPGTVPSDACHVGTGCTDDACDDAGALVACVRGRAVVVDCTALGLKSCNPITTAESQTPVPSCNP